jgi:hypothetical protein
MIFAFGMTDKKTWGSTVMGWFLVQEPSGNSGNAAAAASGGYRPFSETGQTEGGPSRSSPQQLNVFTTPPPDAPGGNVDFEKVFAAAGLDSGEQERVLRTKDLLDSLPPGTDGAVKKQIVMASLKAFGVPIEKIIESGAQEIQALEAYIRTGAADTEKVAAEAEQRIKQYEEEIAKLRTVMQQRVQEQNAVIQNCNAKKLEVQKVLEFFGQEAVARVVHDSPKLHEPTAG